LWLKIKRTAMGDLQGKVAVVTGAAAGIGRATAAELARRGATVIVNYRRSQAAAESLVAELRAAGRTAEACGCDVTRAADVRDMFARVEAQFGRVDVLVNNAGDLVDRRPLAEVTESLYREVMDVNVLSTLLCSQVVAEGMKARGSGAIVNMSSLAAATGGGPGAFVYGASKAAIIAITKGTAKELAPHGIRVNCVAPGLIATDFHVRFTPAELFATMSKSVPLGRAGTADEVARVIAFLASDDASYVVGETIEINGGLLMR
jgi:3-oxoacyl-[acyl-carrier protein] reductase